MSLHSVNLLTGYRRKLALNNAIFKHNTVSFFHTKNESTMRKLPPLNAIRIFEECARSLSFTAAARTLCVTHSAISHQIRQLESWLGVTLFTRHASGIVLTPQGEELRRCASEALGNLELTCQRLKTEPPGKELVIGAPASFLANWLIPRIERFEQRYPHIQVRMKTNATPSGLLTGAVDLMIQSNSLGFAPELRTTPLLAELTGPLCAPQWQEKFSTSESLLSLPRLHTASHPNAWQEWARAMGVVLPEPGEGRKLDHLTLMLEAAISGLGIAIAPDLLVERELAAGRLVAPLGFVATGFAFAMGIVEARQNEPELALLWQWLMEESEATPASSS